jgi:hypothetical protein
MLYAIIIGLLLVIVFLLSYIFDKEYKHARISHKFKKSISGSEVYFNFYFIVLYMNGNIPKSKTIQVSQEVYGSYNVGDKITI